MAFKSYKVEFNYTVVETASMYVIAESEEAAADGGMQMLAETDGMYGNAEITNVSVFKRETQSNPTIN